MKDEEDAMAVFSEQGTSASHLAAAKFLDAISRLPGCDGDDSDATGAYTQAVLMDAEGAVETWIRLPRDQWPASWHGKYRNPVVPWRLNLYRHPLAGLYWEKHCRARTMKCGFKPVKGCECFYCHAQKQVFLSVYVDDFKLAGRKESLPEVWKMLGSMLDLEPAVPVRDNVYLGCG